MAKINRHSGASAIITQSSIKSADRSEVTFAATSAKKNRVLVGHYKQKLDAKVARAIAVSMIKGRCGDYVPKTRRVSASFGLRGTFSATRNMSTARKRKRFALERQESGARSGRASLSSGLWKSNDNLVDPFLLLYGCGLSESGLKYDIATYHEQMLLGLCLKNAANNPNKSSESVRLVLSMVFLVWQDDIAGLNPSIWNIIMLLLMVERKSKVTSISTAKKYVHISSGTAIEAW